MKIINRSRKIIGINGEPFLPGTVMEIPDGAESHPVIADYMAKGIIVDAEKATLNPDDNGISDAEKKRIAEEAVAKYRAEQEAIASAKAEKEAEIKAVQSMKKMELLTKAAGLGLEVKDDDTVEDLKEKIITALSE